MKTLFWFLLVFTTVAWTQPRKMGDRPFDTPGHRPMHEMRMMEKLKLTDDQRKQFGKLHSDLQKKQIALRAKIQSLRIDVRDGFREDKPDRAKIESRVNEISKLQGEMKTNHLGFWFDVHKMLTPEQQKLWKEAPMMMRKKGEKMRRRMHRMHEMRMMDHEDD